VLGQRTGVALDAELDESLHTKALFLAVSAQEGVKARITDAREHPPSSETT
jgi:hypothetical protein